MYTTTDNILLNSIQIVSWDYTLKSFWCAICNWIWVDLCISIQALFSIIFQFNLNIMAIHKVSLWIHVILSLLNRHRWYHSNYIHGNYFYLWNEKSFFPNIACETKILNDSSIWNEIFRRYMIFWEWNQIFFNVHKFLFYKNTILSLQILSKGLNRNFREERIACGSKNRYKGGSFEYFLLGSSQLYSLQ